MLLVFTIPTPICLMEGKDPADGNIEPPNSNMQVLLCVKEPSRCDPY